eukprot:2943221-Rhodomonas_salina.2
MAKQLTWRKTDAADGRCQRGAGCGEAAVRGALRRVIFWPDGTIRLSCGAFALRPSGADIDANQAQREGRARWFREFEGALEGDPGALHWLSVRVIHDTGC